MGARRARAGSPAAAPDAANNTYPRFVPIHRYESLDSTSLHARREFLAGRVGESPAVFVAGSQTGGVGRLGRRWWSPVGGLWLTLVQPLGGRAPSILGPLVGAGMCHAVEDALNAAGRGATVRFKWPNDLMLNDAKVGGVLIEAVRREAASAAVGTDGPGSARQGASAALLVGVGINANFPRSQLVAEIQGRATTLLEAEGPVDLAVLESRVLSTLEAVIAAVLSSDGPEQRAVRGSLVECARARLWGVGQRVNFSRPTGEKVEALVLAMEDDGSLRVTIGGREERLASGELWPV